MKFLVTVLVLVAAIGKSADIAPGVRANIGKSSLKFTENKGQILGPDGAPHPEIDFVTGKGGLTIFIGENGLSYQVRKNNYRDTKNNHDGNERRQVKELLSTETFRMDMQLENANSNVRISTEGKSTGCSNYYSRGVTDVHSYSKVTYHNVYNGIDWIIYINDNKLKYDFEVHPGADHRQIKLKFNHQEGLSLNNDGTLSISCRLGTVTDLKPQSFQGAASVASSYVLRQNIVQFNVDRYDHLKTLVIDPSVIWSTYFGEDADEKVYGCTVDSQQNVYIAGATDSQGLIAPGGYQENYGGLTDAFLAKFDMDGLLLWSTYYGGSAQDIGYSCAVDALDNVYLCGITASSSGIGSGGFDNTYGGNSDAFLVKFDNGGSLQWATYYGGSNVDYGNECAVDPSGNVYLAGCTSSSAGISTPGSHQPTYGQSMDAYLVKFNSAGSRLWATYYGGSGEESGFNYKVSCATDPSGNIFLAGTTSSNNNISSSNGHQIYFGGAYFDCFMVKFNGSGVRQWATYLGGSGMEEVADCTTDAQGYSYLTGTTKSGNNIAFQGFDNFVNQSSYDDLFLVRFSPAGVRQWGTYYGGYGQEDGGFCMTDKNNNVYIGGSTSSQTDIASPGYASTFGGGKDGFIVKMAAAGTRSWALYSGGSMSEDGTSGAIDSNNDIYLAGFSDSPNEFGVNGFQTTNHGGFDAFLLKYCGGDGPSKPGAITGSSQVCEGIPYTYSIAPMADAVSYIWEKSGSLTGTSTTNSISVTSGFSGGNLSVVSSGTCGYSAPSVIYVQAFQAPQITVTQGSSVYCTGMQLQLTASGASNYTWSAGSLLPTQVVSPYATTVYTVTGSNQFSCTSSVPYTVVPNTVTAFNFTVSGMSASLSISNMACSSFTWDYGNGTGSVLNANPVISYQGSGTYGICLKCNDLPNGCIRCINITVPGNRIDGVGIAEVRDLSPIQIYPNPAAGIFNVTCSFEGAGIITNALGQTVLTVSMKAGVSAVDLQTQPEGVYLLRMYTGGKTYSAKLIRQ